MIKKMRADEALDQWVKEGCTISFWGASEQAITQMRRFIRHMQLQKRDIRWGCIYDNHSPQKYIKFWNVKMEVVSGSQYKAGDTKVILCVTKRQSYHEVVGEMESANAVYGKDYIDIFEFVFAGTKENPYEKITPYATYAPWREDEAFISIYEKVKNNTLVDIYRLYSLWISCRETAKCGRGDIAEIGVWRGGSGALLAHGMKLSPTKEPGKVYLCDTFQGVPKAGSEDTCYSGGEHSDTNLETVEALLKNCEAENTEIEIGIFPDDCYEKFEKKIFRLVHIDVDVYESAKGVFNFVWDKMLPGGMVIFDDYGFDTTVGVTKLCKELERQVEDGRCIFHLNGQAVFVKCGGNG